MWEEGAHCVVGCGEFALSFLMDMRSDERRARCVASGLSRMIKRWDSMGCWNGYKHDVDEELTVELVSSVCDYDPAGHQAAGFES